MPGPGAQSRKRFGTERVVGVPRELREGVQVGVNERTTLTLHSRWEKARGITRIIRLSVGEVWVKTGEGPKQLEVETPVATAVVREPSSTCAWNRTGRAS
jgi:hypothetical protein